MQRMVAVTVVVGADTAAVRGGVFNSGGAAAAVGKGAVGTGDGKHSRRQEAGTVAAAAGGGGREGLADTGKESLLRNSRGLFRYELVRDSNATAISAKEAATAESGHGSSGDDSHHQQRQRPSPSRVAAERDVRSADGTRGIRVRLTRLTEGPSFGGTFRRELERLHGETPVSWGEGVLFEAGQEGYGSASRTVVRVLGRFVCGILAAGQLRTCWRHPVELGCVNKYLTDPEELWVGEIMPEECRNCVVGSLKGSQMKLVTAVGPRLSAPYVPSWIGSDRFGDGRFVWPLMLPSNGQIWYFMS